MDAAPLSDTTLAGACHCGALAYTTTSLPTFSGYCHCEKCQRLTGGPFVATFHFPVDSVTISATPESALHTYSPPFAPHETRYRCNICGVGVCSITTGQMRTAVWGGTLARIPVHGEDGAGRIAMWEKISPALHYNYGARSLDVADHLGKWSGYEGTSERLGG
ncbi:hypothetical protein FOMPIDRAFT_1112861 [Fomitopsis schrenkii]|uniref:CENP-V/GFA domain-containing protein n=1 Tax=Fomitopsis schrenkii TaxID=2126942 RepID=S8EKS5_FOMSC|nr:hypothetical protein FOMPIDRAFT_1112861 [Fomitopsis schrenkii]